MNVCTLGAGVKPTEGVFASPLSVSARLFASQFTYLWTCAEPLGVNRFRTVGSHTGQREVASRTPSVGTSF